MADLDPVEDQLLEEDLIQLAGARGMYQGLGENCLGFGNDTRRLQEQEIAARLIARGAGKVAEPLSNLVTFDPNMTVVGKAYALATLLELLPAVEAAVALEEVILALGEQGSAVLDASMTQLNGCLMRHPTLRELFGNVLSEISVRTLAAVSGWDLAVLGPTLDQLEANGLETVHRIVVATSHGDDDDPALLAEALEVDIGLLPDPVQLTTLVRRAKAMDRAEKSLPTPPPPPPRCLRCNDLAHTTEDCPEPCRHCNRKGHRYADCPARKR